MIREHEYIFVATFAKNGVAQELTYKNTEHTINEQKCITSYSKSAIQIQRTPITCHHLNFISAIHHRFITKVTHPEL